MGAKIPTQRQHLPLETGMDAYHLLFFSRFAFFLFRLLLQLSLFGSFPFFRPTPNPHLLFPFTKTSGKASAPNSWGLAPCAESPVCFLQEALSCGGRVATGRTRVDHYPKPTSHGLRCSLQTLGVKQNEAVCRREAAKIQQVDWHEPDRANWKREAKKREVQCKINEVKWIGMSWVCCLNWYSVYNVLMTNQVLHIS